MEDEGEIDLTGGTMSSKSCPLVLLLAGLALTTAGLPGITPSQAVGQDKTPPRPSPEECLKLLKVGHARYASGQRRFAHLDRTRIADATSQARLMLSYNKRLQPRAPVTFDNPDFVEFGGLGSLAAVFREGGSFDHTL